MTECSCARRPARRPAGEITAHLADADPDRVTTAQAAEILALFAELERLAVAGKVLFSRRAAQGTVWRDEGHRSAAAWMASTPAPAWARPWPPSRPPTALACLPETSQALRRGELSAPQVKVIAEAAVSIPERDRLLKAAADHSLKGLEERAAQVRAAASSAQEENARYLAIHKARYVRHWADPDGAFRLDAKLTPVDGAKLLSALKVEADARFNEARKAGDPGSPRRLWGRRPGGAGGRRAEVTDVEGLLRARSARSTVVIRVDGRALKRGYAKAGEVCDIAGVGPVPVAAVKRQLSDAFVKILVHDGVDVTTVCHVGRTVPAHVQSALESTRPGLRGAGLRHRGPGSRTITGTWTTPMCKTTSPQGVGPGVSLAPRPHHLRGMDPRRWSRVVAVERATRRVQLRDRPTVSGHGLSRGRGSHPGSRTSVKVRFESGFPVGASLVWRDGRVRCRRRGHQRLQLSRRYRSLPQWCRTWVQHLRLLHHPVQSDRRRHDSFAGREPRPDLHRIQGGPVDRGGGHHSHRTRVPRRLVRHSGARRRAPTREPTGPYRGAGAHCRGWLRGPGH